jgi:pyrophosphatase PpaX
MNINTIVFDLDGTLIDASALIPKAFNYALAPYGITVTTEEIERMRSMTDKELFLDILHPHQAKEALARLWEYSKISAHETLLIQEIKSLLHVLKNSNKNLKIGIWTGRDRASTINILQAHKIHDYFDEIVGGCQLQKNKPNPEGLLLLAKKLDSSLENIIHIGDHEHDLIGASSVGVKVVHAKWYQPNPPSILHPLANFTFDSLQDFSVWIDQLI